MSYTEQLYEIGLTIVGQFTTAKAKHTLQCRTCEHIWEATPISKVQAYKKYGTNGCPACNENRRSGTKETKRVAARQALLDKGFEILSEWDGSQSTTYKILVRNTKCQHEFESAPGNLLHRDVICPTCNNEAKAERCLRNNQLSREEYYKTATEWQQYKAEVQSLTRITYEAHKETINPLNLPRRLNGIADAYQLDHIVPVRWCFDNNVPPEICADVTNLQMLPWHQNSVARARIKEDVAIPEVLQPYVNK